MSAPRTVSIMGSTGSVGQSAISAIKFANGAGREPVYEIDTLCAHRDVDGLARQAIEFNAKLAVIADESCLDELRNRLHPAGIECAGGDAAVQEAATRPCDRLIAAIVGIAGLHSTFAAVRAGNDVVLANKESMVCAGPLLKQEALKSGAQILPADSEHNAIFQVLERLEDVERLILTASGGPFRTWTREQMLVATPELACAHPRWEMGRKISVDSATLMNKGLELIEASYLFDMPEDRIDVVVHPQSAIHSLVAYRDGSLLAQIGTPDMQVPLSHALSWPNRRQPTAVPLLDLVKTGSFEFEALDDSRFAGVSLARKALRAGGMSPAVLNCANEVAVAAFLEGQCGFLDISLIVENTLEQFSASAHASECARDLDEIEAIDVEARRLASTLLERVSAGA